MNASRIRTLATSSSAAAGSSGNLPTVKLPPVHRPVGTGGRSSLSGHTATVFGCSGFLGKYLVHELAKRGTQVVVAYRGSAEYIRDLKVCGDLGQVVPLRFDSRDESSLRECMRHSDTVYNLIGNTAATRNFSLYDTHVEAARQIARVAQSESKVEKLIHVSCMSADSKSQSEILSTKGKGEVAVQLEFPDALIVRPGPMYGLDDQMIQYLGKTLTHPVKRWFTGGFIPLVDGGVHTMSPVYVNDVARGLYRLMVQEELPQDQKLFEFRGPRQMPYREFVELFCEYARKPFNPLSVPYPLFRQIVSWSEKNPLRRINVHDVDRAVVDEVVTGNSGSLESVGVQPQAVEDLIIKFVRHYRGQESADQPATLGDIKYWKRNDMNSQN